MKPPKLSGPSNYAIEVTPDGKYLFVLERATLYRFAYPSGEAHETTFDEAFDALAVSVDTVACANEHGVTLFDLEGNLRRTCKPPEALESVTGVAMSPDGRFCAVASGHNNAARNTIEIWSVAGGHVRTIETEDTRRALAFSADSKHVVTTTTETLEFWAVDGEDRSVASVDAFTADTIDISPDGRILLTSGGFAVFDAEGRMSLEKRGHYGIARFDRRGEWIVASQNNVQRDRKAASILHVFSPAGTLREIARPNSRHVEDLLFSDDETVTVVTNSGGMEFHPIGASPSKRTTKSAKPEKVSGSSSAPAAPGKKSRRKP